MRELVCVVKRSYRTFAPSVSPAKGCGERAADVDQRLVDAGQCRTVATFLGQAFLVAPALAALLSFSPARSVSSLLSPARTPLSRSPACLLSVSSNSRCVGPFPSESPALLTMPMHLCYSWARLPHRTTACSHLDTFDSLLAHSPALTLSRSMPSLTSLVTFLALALPLASAGAAHYSHPRNAALVARNAHGRVAGKARTLPRTGRRLSKRQEATLKCLTAYTFALCDGDNCTDMGSVAGELACSEPFAAVHRLTAFS